MARSRTLLAVIVLVVIGSVPATLAEDRARPALAIIVHPQRAEDLGPPEIRSVYLRRRLLWDDGDAIVPVNREAGSTSRARFESQVLGRSAAWLARYWNERYFEGVFPPITFASDEAVRRYVASHPRAIGYVLASVVDDTVRIAWTTRSSGDRP